MPVTRNNSLLVSGASMKLQHGVYPMRLRANSSLGTGWAAKQKAQHEWLIVWFGEPREGLYPYMSDFKRKRAREELTGLPQGGIRMDMDYSVGTYGLYKFGANAARFKLWADFDHWPIGANGLQGGLANGHFHEAKSTAVQLPVTARMLQILRMVHVYK